MKSVVVTGVSTGIGETTAKYLAAQGFKVYGSVRKPEDGARLRQEIGSNFEPLIFDVTDEAAIKVAAAKVRADLNGQTLAGLVNNAGIAVPGPFLETSLDKWRKQFEANVIARGGVVHWATAVLVLVLLATGAALYAGPVSTLVGRRELVKTVHVLAGLALPVPLVLGLVLPRRGRALRADTGRINRFDAEDRRWLRRRMTQG